MDSISLLKSKNQVLEIAKEVHGLSNCDRLSAYKLDLLSKKLEEIRQSILAEPTPCRPVLPHLD